ncbi:MULTISPECIES: ABC transporter permease [unclassified Oceanispirochaeta]|uniref:ABC transporter permease n=1 Tax=unclassified Oceanispirochaeta TaxID=2635722 RepID=UPI000E08F97B|nr:MULTISPECIES: ABC transporter permease [unclassified Oceanispirochaeta]MBF9018544.1 ABC transporter permease [Oceanispirochaeta sp. M2]NPD74951.1 ABC transporter permease [Oceanispirochaeta sp. M1]RDG29182.1 ABC transporter permease [Oceanispirochaeta sp. M1]
MFKVKTRINPEMKVLSMILAGSFIIMAILSPSHFLRLETFQGMAFQLPELGLLSLAMMISMLTGGINLSIIATANISSITAALILTSYINPEIASSGDGMVILLAILAALTVSVLVGLFNGILISIVNIPPILATLGTMKLLQGLAFIITRGYVISGMPDFVRFIGNGTVIGIPMPLILFAIFAWLMAFYLNHTATGFNIFLFGSNSVATFFSGVNNTKVIIQTYMLSGLYCGVAALIMMSRFNSAKAGYGESYLLVTILAAVLGGVKSEGGFGEVTGLILSLVILQIISNGLNLLGVSSFLTVAFWGLIMIAAMIIHFLARRNSQNRISLEKKN